MNIDLDIDIKTYNTGMECSYSLIKVTFLCLFIPDTPKAGEVSSPPCCRPEVTAAGKPDTVKRPPPDPLLPRDDLRAYAYEGDGSSAGSLGSAKAGQPQVFFTRHWVSPEYFYPS